MLEHNKKDYSGILEDMEAGEEWSILDEDLMHSGVKADFQEKKLLRIGKRLKNFLKYKH